MTDVSSTSPKPHSETIVIDGKTVHFIRARTSQECQSEIRRAAERLQPDSICIELDASRLQRLRDPNGWKCRDLFDAWREGEIMAILGSVIARPYERALREQVGLAPGTEQLEGFLIAEASGCEVILADRDVATTLERTLSRMGFLAKAKIGFDLAFRRQRVFPEQDALRALAANHPRLRETFVEERTAFTTHHIRHAPGPTVLAIVGADHFPDVVENLSRNIDIHSLKERPRPPRWRRFTPLILPALILTLMVLALVHADSSVARESVGRWILFHGGCSALGVWICGGHGLSIMAAFIAAPLWTAAMVTGSMQAWIRRPRVGDLEDFRRALKSFRSARANRATRALMVALVANMGGTLGSFLAGISILRSF